MITQCGEVNVVLSDHRFGTIKHVSDFLRLEVTANADNEIGHVSLRLPLKYLRLLTSLGLFPTRNNPCPCNPFLTLQIHRSIKCGPWYLEFCEIFFITEANEILSADKQRWIELEAEGSDWLLGKRLANEPPEGANVAFMDVPADNVAHSLFAHFFGPAAPGGDRDFIAVGLMADGGSAGMGPDYTTDASYTDLLTAIQQAAEFSAGRCKPFYFGLVPTKTPTPNGEQPGLPLVFETRFGQWGEDRTQGNTAGNTPVVLSAQRGNINSYRFGSNWADSASVVYVVGEDPVVGVAMDEQCMTTPWSWCESTISDTEITTADVANDRAEAELSRLNEGDEFALEITPCADGGLYGKTENGGDWWLGDSLTIDYQTGDGCADPTNSAVAINVRNTSINYLVERCREAITGNFQIISCKECEPEPLS